MHSMSTSTEHMPVPEWDLADRLGKALRVAGISIQEMAMYLGVHRNTVSAWVNGRTPISGPALRSWSTRTGVPFEWLVTGNVSDGPEGGLLATPFDPATQPSGWKVAAA